ncbi:MAG: hypothetical protein A2600_05640 [Candidatus Lambdaproteobacteria bacterium RIFOXYD1_FULL_56_27]|uniref:Uncharacterized protein n=1 Tax=Candidatus Lambdaproteobacteria bacterium RIFOXYD2_FULL_56_26 TaxID=1817773 RepID=A0A1F6GRF6_9PROT|nr:MAG: hypothetical protein A2426_10845 [Candidatus Lambdaproteobacteria bacterium RIFOXYC1_FULL_56_13]OGH00684.1 MAG: hypothetical protein A2557_03345 [Candidatus Lambdaproteobacteria bacterium RIFOXYD2_FULL_56_26]OGH07851.1 MAG: hypothetical protein A2600_05640 [Candidatus Lambdaproteobacteria bacterium RIFOXYD1_FULL_56_27]
MEASHRCKVVFDPNLSEAEVELRLQAIRLVSGVVRVETESSGTRVPDPQEGITIEYEPRLSKSQVVAQRELIQRVLVWGITQGLVKPEQISKLEPEQLVQTAMSLMDKMPEEEKKRLGRDFGRASSGGP